MLNQLSKTQKQQKQQQQQKKKQIYIYIDTHHLKDTAGGETQGEREALMSSLLPFCSSTSSSLSEGFAIPSFRRECQKKPLQLF